MASTKVPHMIGRPGDALMAFAAEKCNCTQVAEMVFDRLGHTRRGTAWVHDYRWGPYIRKHPAPTVDEIRASKTPAIKFVRDPVERFKSIWKRYLKHGMFEAPSDMSLDELLDWLETKNVWRYAGGYERVHDMHATSQRFVGETDDLWAEIVHVEGFRDPEVRTGLRERYGLLVDPEYRSDHWDTDGPSVEFTAEQERRIRQVYHMDAAYAYQ